MSIFKNASERYYAKVVFSSETCMKHYYKIIQVQCKCCGQFHDEHVRLSTETMPKEVFINECINRNIKLKKHELTPDERCKLCNDLMSELKPGTMLILNSEIDFESMIRKPRREPQGNDYGKGY